MGTVLSSFGAAATVGGGGGGVGGSRKRADGARSSDLEAVATKDDDCGNVEPTPTTANVDAKPSPSPRKQWPCSNCHSMVASDQVRCANCHGIQVKILASPIGGAGSSPPNFVYLERVMSPSSATRTTPTAAVLKSSSPASAVPPEPTLQDPVLTIASVKERLEESDDTTKEKALESYQVDDDDDGESVTSDYYDNDGMDDVETLEASPRPSDFAAVGAEELLVDELRPMNPVAATLASVPSPIPASLKLEAASVGSLPSLSSSLLAATAVPEGVAGPLTIGGSDGFHNKKRPALMLDINASELPDDDEAGGAIQLMPSSKKKIRMS